jgi:hypothetical protein
VGDCTECISGRVFPNELTKLFGDVPILGEVDEPINFGGTVQDAFECIPDRILDRVA